MIPILYSFRRCPYAIRARIALHFSGINVELREVSLKNKPYDLLNLSKKGTVPVLKTDENILDESLDIILWALGKSDKFDLLKPYLKEKIDTIKKIDFYDTEFKYNLDRYKYSKNFENNPSFKGKDYYREKCKEILQDLDLEITKNKHLYIFKSKLSILDICIFPFVRQFRLSDPKWFDSEFHDTSVNMWFNNIVKSYYFAKVMQKYEEWLLNKKTYIY